MLHSLWSAAQPQQVLLCWIQICMPSDFAPPTAAQPQKTLRPMLCQKMLEMVLILLPNAHVFQHRTAARSIHGNSKETGCEGGSTRQITCTYSPSRTLIGSPESMMLECPLALPDAPPTHDYQPPDSPFLREELGSTRRASDEKKRFSLAELKRHSKLFWKFENFVPTSFVHRL